MERNGRRKVGGRRRWKVRGKWKKEENLGEMKEEMERDRRRMVGGRRRNTNEEERGRR